MQLWFHHVWLHGENFASGSHEFKLLFQNFFEPIVLSNNQQHALTQDIIGKQ